jgi:tetratricopeptide (TPR) repeat protein
LQRYAYQEARAYFEHALQELKRLPENRANREQAIDLYFSLRNVLYPLREYDRVFAYLREAESLAEALDDHSRLGWASQYLAFHYADTGEVDHALTHGQRALALSGDDFALQVRARYNLGLASFHMGHFRQALDYFRQNVAVLTGELIREHFGGSGSLAIQSRTWWLLCLAEIGAFTEGRARCEELVQLAEGLDHPWSRNSACFGASHLYLRQGALLRAIQLLERGVELSRNTDLLHWFRGLAPRLSFAYAHIGRVDEALALMAQVQEKPLPINSMIWLSEVSLVSGDEVEAINKARHILRLAQSHQNGVLQAWTLRLLGEISRRHTPLQINDAEAYFRQALTLADELGMRPLQAHCHNGLGTLYSQTGQSEQARAELTTAIEMYRDMEMAFWLPETEAVLSQVV